MSTLITVLIFLLLINAGGSDYYCEDLGERIPTTQSCNGKCWFGNQFVCPSNPSNCNFFRNSCDGRMNPLCKENYCSGRIEDYPFYDISSRRCIKDQDGDSFEFCGKRPGATYHNNQCFEKVSSESLQYNCLNRMDISENVIRQTSIYKPQVDPRLNLFALFESNDTHIICENNSLEKPNCNNLYSESQIDETLTCKGQDFTIRKVCAATDFLEANNITPFDLFGRRKRSPSLPSNCGQTQFFCTKSRQCIHKGRICDGIKDCEDEGEDEELEECKRRKTFPSEATLPCYEFGRPEKYQVHI